ncbi:hypothetical protein ACRAWD_04055 [Caulobacter segnis]
MLNKTGPRCRKTTCATSRPASAGSIRWPRSDRAQRLQRSAGRALSAKHSFDLERITELEPEFLNPAHGEPGHVHDEQLAASVTITTITTMCTTSTAVTTTHHRDHGHDHGPPPAPSTTMA